MSSSVSNTISYLARGAGLNYLNIFLIVLSFALAYVIPFELLLIAYAALGPAHYLTEISWLHDRGYFLKNTFLIVAFVIVCFLAAVGTLLGDEPAILVCFVAALAFSLPIKIWGRIVLSFLMAMAALFLYQRGVGIWFLILLPTVLHVFIFTLFFMLQGAVATKSFSASLAAGLFVICACAFFILPPTASETLSRLATMHGYYFDGVRTTLLGVLGLPVTWSSWVAVSGFLSFAYLYHYLNWFSKTSIIGWHTTSKERLLAVIIGSVASVALYLYDYQIGFVVLLLLSILHALLEFPLDIKVAAGLGKSAFKAISFR